MPQFETVFRDLGSRLNPGAAFVLAASTWLHANFDLFIGGCLVVVLGTWLVLHKRERRARLISWLAVVPGIGGTMRDRRTVRLIGTLGLLAANGVPLPAALKILRNIVAEPRQVAAIDQLHDQVRNGRRFADALADTDLLPPMAVRMLKVGDETGDLRRSRACGAILRAQAQPRDRSADGRGRAGRHRSRQHCHRGVNHLDYVCAVEHHGFGTMTQTYAAAAEPRDSRARPSGTDGYTLIELLVV